MKYQDQNGYCVVTGQQGVDLHHVKSKGSGGTDNEFNLMPLCHAMHQELHQIGLNKFSGKYPGARNWLLNNGWKFDAVLMRWSRQ